MLDGAGRRLDAKRGKPVFISCGQDRKCDAGLLDWSAPHNAAIELPAAAEPAR
jgi:hypothetical protein